MQRQGWRRAAKRSAGGLGAGARFWWVSIRRRSTKIAALTKVSTVEEIAAILRLMAKRPAGLRDEEDLQTLTKKTKLTLGALRKQLSAYRKEGNGDKAGKAEPGGAPVPDDLGNAAWIWTNWGHNVVVKAALARLGRMNETDPTLFIGDDKGTVVRVEAINGRMVIKQMQNKEWRAALSQKLEFKQWIPLTGNVSTVAADKSTFEAIMGSENKPFPSIERVVHVPVFAPDGTLRWDRGYVPEMKTYLDPDRVEWMPVSKQPSKEEMDTAIGLIMEPFRDFPFSDAFDGRDPLSVKDRPADATGYRQPNWKRGRSSRAHAVAMVLQHFARNLIDGPCPFYHIDKVSPGEGAGYLMNVINGITDGQQAVARPLSEKRDEVQKVITGLARGGSSVSFFDNINHAVDSGPLAAAATTGKWKDRILGKSEDSPEIPLRGIWCFAGNGNKMKLTRELMRRMMPIKLDSAVPNPEERPPETFKYYPLWDWIMEHRRELVWACHTIIQNWVARGMSPGAGHLASFEHYTRVMGGILAAAGIDEFLGNRSSYMSYGKDADDDTAVAGIRELFRRHGFAGGGDGQGFDPDDVSDALTKLGDGFTIPFQAQSDPNWLNRKICDWIEPLTRRTFSVSPVDPFSAMGQPVDPFRAPRDDFAGNVKLVRVWKKPARFRFYPVVD